VDYTKTLSLDTTEQFDIPGASLRSGADRVCVCVFVFVCALCVRVFVCCFRSATIVRWRGVLNAWLNVWVLVVVFVCVRACVDMRVRAGAVRVT
jgi:hypothetical protein